MKHRNLILGFALALGTLGAIGVGTAVGSYGTPNEVKAAGEGEEEANKAYFEIVGSLSKYSSVSWTPGYGLKMNGSEDRDGVTWYYADVSFNAGDTFKVVYNYWEGADFKTNWIAAWGVNFEEQQIYGWQGNDDNNFHVNADGDYRFFISSEAYNSTSNPGNRNLYDIKSVQAESFEATLYLPDGSTKKETASSLAEYNPSWFKVDGYVNRGWYTDLELETEYVPAAPTSDITLYGKWETAPADLTVYYEGDFTHAYIYSSDASYKNNTWPGVAMEKIDRAWGTNVYKFVVEGEYEANMIIFNNGGQGQQSANITLAKETAVYNGWQDDEGLKGQVADDSDDKLAALDFITEFDTLRKDGDICYLVNNTGHEDALNSIITKYEAIENKDLVDNLEDIGTDAPTTIGTTMAMLIAKKNSTSGVYGVYSTDPYNTTWIVILALAGASVLLGGAFFALKRKKARK